MRVEIFPIEGISLCGEHPIADHINLSGSSPQLGFNAVTDLYKAKHDPNGIIVACLKPGTKPNKEEAEFLIKQGVKAYSYSLLEPALYAAARGEMIDAYGYVTRIPNGFKLYAAAAGFKESGKKDLGLIIADAPCKWAGSFTQNRSRAACVDHNFAMLGSTVKALICNSGIANACTGDQGREADQKMRQILAENFPVSAHETITASTGKIGVALDLDLLDPVLKNFSLEQAGSAQDHNDILNFAEAILTTDTVIKVSQDKAFNVLGLAKGSGMINPNMATMLGFLISDVKSSCNYQEILNRVVAKSFNAISVDGDTSTNDMVIFMTNETGKEVSPQEFETSLEEVCLDLAQKIMLDGEGTQKIIKLELTGFEDEDTKTIADEILNSLLVKTAIFGHDPNWGRIISALGNAYARLNKDLDLSNISLDICASQVYKNGMPTEFDRTELAQLMQKHKFIEINCRLENPIKKEPKIYFGSDLSYKYVEINAEYFS